MGVVSLVGEREIKPLLNPTADAGAVL